MLQSGGCSQLTVRQWNSGAQLKRLQFSNCGRNGLFKTSQRLHKTGLFRDEETRQEVTVVLVTANIDRCRKQWPEYLLRTDGSRIPKIAFEYNAKDRRDAGHPQIDGRCEVGTGQGLILKRKMMIKCMLNRSHLYVRMCISEISECLSMKYGIRTSPFKSSRKSGFD